MLPQGVLGFQYEPASSNHGLTSLPGLPLNLHLIQASGLGAAIHRHVGVAGRQGWLDIQMVLAVLFLNLAGGDCWRWGKRMVVDIEHRRIRLSIESNVDTQSLGNFRCLFHVRQRNPAML